MIFAVLNNLESIKSIVIFAGIFQNGNIPNSIPILRA